MIVTEHVTGCLASSLLTVAQLEHDARGGQAWGAGGEQKLGEFCLLDVVPISTRINFEENVSLRGQKNNSLCSANLGNRSYKGDKKTESTKSMNGLRNPFLTCSSAPADTQMLCVVIRASGDDDDIVTFHIYLLCTMACVRFCACITLFNVIG